MNRYEAIDRIIENISGNELVVHSNGAISRESFSCRDRRENFYCLGSMGLASSIGLGLALSCPDRRVFVLDGDGNILMGFGNLALIGALKPDNLVHIILDNRCYGTTGNQSTISNGVKFDSVAVSCGYRNAVLVHTAESLVEEIRNVSRTKGPSLLHVLVDQDVPKKCPRIPYSAKEIRDRFLEAVSG